MFTFTRTNNAIKEVQYDLRKIYLCLPKESCRFSHGVMATMLTEDWFGQESEGCLGKFHWGARTVV